MRTFTCRSTFLNVDMGWWTLTKSGGFIYTPLGVFTDSPSLEKVAPNWSPADVSQSYCNGNSVYIFLFWELLGLSPNFHIHVSVSDLYIPRIGPHISSSREGRSVVGNWEYIIRSQTHECGNWYWYPNIPFWQYLFQIFSFKVSIFGILSLQCGNINVLLERKFKRSPSHWRNWSIYKPLFLCRCQREGGRSFALAYYILKCCSMLQILYTYLLFCLLR